jgi:hypothetical protein
MSPERANELWDLYLAEALDDAGARELLAYLQANPEELQRRRADASIHGGLRYLFGNAEECQRLVASVRARLKINAVPGEESGFAKRVMTDVLHRQPTPRSASVPLWAKALIAASIAFAFGVYVWQQAPSAPVLKEGGVTLELQSGRATLGARNLQAPVETRLSAGETLTLDATALARIPFPDGSELKLSESGTLTITRLEAPILLKLQHGVAELDVRPQPTGKEMVLETRQARVRVPWTTTAWARFSQTRRGR